MDYLFVYFLNKLRIYITDWNEIWYNGNSRSGKECLSRQIA